MTPWWLWWNILSVDAPTVALVWAYAFAQTIGEKLSAIEVVALGLTVWVIYAGDRLLDSRNAKNCADCQERHRFCARHRTLICCLILFVASNTVWIIIEFLKSRELSAGTGLSAVIALYLVVVHVGPRWVTRAFPKELAVGVLFAAGVTLPVWYAVTLNWKIWSSIILFALLCTLNCLSIEAWESRRTSADTPHLVRWAKPRIERLAIALAILAEILSFTHFREKPIDWVLSAIVLAALSICLLNRFRNWLSQQALRVLVDIAFVVAGLLVLVIRL